MPLSKKPLTSVQNALRSEVNGAKKAVKGTAKRIAKNTLTNVENEIISRSREKWYNPKSSRSVAKQRSDYIYNERRRAQRLVNRLEKDLTFQEGVQRRATRQYINALKREIEKTYAPRKGTRTAEARQMAAVENLVKATRGTGRNATLTRRDRQKRIFAHQMNLASKGLNSTLGKGELGRGKMKIFLRQTQYIWEGLGNENRLDAIRTYYEAVYGRQVELEEIFDAVMRENQGAVSALESQVEEFESTDENAFYYEEEEYMQEAGSPGYLDFVTTRVFIAL